MNTITLAPGLTLIHGDCMEYINNMRAAAVDIVLTDPPYGIDGSSGNVNKKRGKGNYSSDFEDTPENVRTFVVPVITRLIELCRCVVVTPGNKNFSFYPQPDSFGTFYQPAAVGLQTFGNLDAQPIFYYGKNASGKNMGVPCSYQLTEAPEKNGHPCVKPINIWRRLLSNISRRGLTVFDPFMGSGTTGVACVQLGLNFIGCELNADYFSIAKERIERELKQPFLPGIAERQPVARAEQARLLCD